MARDKGRDTTGGGDVGAHLGSDVGRGIGPGDLPDMHASRGGGRSSSTQGQDARDDLTDETLGGTPELRSVGPGIISDDPQVLGMGGGDPGYTAEEDDEGDGPPTRPTQPTAGANNRKPR